MPTIASRLVESVRRIRMPAMTRLTITITTLITSVVLLGHAALFSFLYLRLGHVVQHSHESLFVNDVHSISSSLARQLEAGDLLESEQFVGSLLDTMILNTDGVYAELVGPGQTLRGVRNEVNVTLPSTDDRAFGDRGDNFYFITVPVHRRGVLFQLHLAFDERPTRATIASAKRQLLLTLILYLGISSVAALLLARRIIRPIQLMQDRARQVATGAHETRLAVTTRVRELAVLAADLERMRGALVGVSENLRAQISETHALEQRRATLERQLQHRERIETVGTLAGGIAHDINNMLVPIILLGELTLKSVADRSRVHADVTTILAAARRARDQVKQILAFSRDVAVANLEVLDLREMAEEALKLIKPLVSEHCQLRTDLETPCAMVRADRSLAIQLLVNLIKNALQSLEHSSGRVDVRIADVERQATEGASLPAGRYVEVLVQDTGSGMDEATRARIFEPYFTTRAVGQGTGLGLSVAHGIAVSLGGAILVDSTPGAGSTFRVLIPAAGSATTSVYGSGPVKAAG